MPSLPRPHLLVTRPADRQEPFGRHARALGFDTLTFPCLEIRPEAGARLPEPRALAAFEAVLFTSRPAVEAAARLRPFPWPGATALAIGAATGEALERAGQSLAREPVPPFTSEALLASLAEAPPLASVLLLKGHGGRQALERLLAERGTRVRTLTLYRRACPAPGVDLWRRTFVESSPDIVSSTSDEGLANLVELAGDARDALRSLPLIVNSERAVTNARALGFTGPVRVAVPAGDAGQLVELAAWIAERGGCDGRKV